MPAILLFFLLWPGLLAAEPLNVALLLEHEQPSAWTDLLRKGLLANPEIRAEVIIAPPGEKQREIFRSAAASHDLVLVASDSLHEALRDNAANFRRVKFGSIDAGIRAPNIMSVTFADEQAAFLAGAAAALFSAGRQPQNPAIGWLSGQDTPAMRSLFSGYSEGALLASPGVRIIQAVAGSFTDSAKAASKAEWLIDSGVAVLALAAGAGNGAARAVAQARGIPVLELDAASGSASLGVIEKAADRAVAEIVAAAASGNFRGKEILTYTLANGGVNFRPGGIAAGNPEIARRLKELRLELEKGSIRLRSLRQRALCDCLD
ncbi:MAG: BMP family ABC transporter substrate-binding protein [Desulfovibrio sp.]|nr:BMP family ABC transporter substrate-binding protein [Desulfovibrio sp.]